MYIKTRMFLVLRAAGLLEGMYNIAEGIYSLVAALGRTATGTDTFLFWILSGVLQGCPLAGSFFVLAMDPFFSCFHRKIEISERGVVRGCADDVGAALKDISDLLTMKQVFDSAQTLAGLALKPAKVFIVPLIDRNLESLQTFAQQWLLRHVPSWAAFRGDLCAKYLGVYMGPGGGGKLWQNAISKWLSRSFAIAAAKAPMGTTLHLYNTRAIPTLLYLAQIAPLPVDVRRKELGVLSRLFHIPHNSLSRSAAYNLARWGSVRVDCPEIMAKACRLRAAVKTLDTWQVSLARMASAAQEHLPMDRFFAGLFWGRQWDAPPFAACLSDASTGFPMSNLQGGIGMVTVR